MPEFYLIGSILLTACFILFWGGLVLHAFYKWLTGDSSSSDTAASPRSSSSREGTANWSWKRLSEGKGILTVNERKYTLYNSCHIRLKNSPLIVDIRQLEERSCNIIDVLVNGHSVAGTSPYSPLTQNEHFVAYAMSYVRSLKNQGLLDEEDINTLDEIYEQVTINDRLLKEGKVRQPDDTELADYIWVG